MKSLYLLYKEHVIQTEYRFKVSMTTFGYLLCKELRLKLKNKQGWGICLDPEPDTHLTSQQVKNIIEDHLSKNIFIKLYQNYKASKNYPELSL